MMVTVRSEYPSISEYLQERLSPDDLQSLGFISVNQYAFTLGAVAEVALSAQAIGSKITVGFWADYTPLPDTGWETSRKFSRLLRTKTKDQRAEEGLLSAGLPPSSLAAPPIRHWKPQGLPNLPRPLTRSAIRELEYRGSAMGRSILQVHPDFNTPIRDDYVWPRRWISRATRSYAWVYDQTTELIKQRGLTAIAVYNGRFTHDQAIAAAATDAGVRVLYYDTGGLETDYEFTVNSLHDWDDLQARMRRMFDTWPDADRDDVARAWFENRRAHSEPGFEVFVGSQTKGHLEGVPEAREVVVFFSSSGDEIYELDLDWDAYLNSQEDALAALASACRARPDCTLIVRTHPHMRLKPADDLDNWNAAVDAANPHVHFDANSPIDSYELMRAASLVFTYGSTAGVEAAYAERPVVIMGPSAHDLLGCGVRIRNASEIPPLLAQPPVASSADALPYGLMMQRRGFNFEKLLRDQRGIPLIGGIALEDASPNAMKLSHLRKRALYSWLTRA